MVCCSHHGNDQTTDDTVPGYVVCEHVLEEGAPIAHVDYATEQQIGAIICALPGDAPEHSVEHLHLICSVCARTRGFVPAA